MSKNSGMGRKRVDNKDSKGLGKCAPNSRGEQCGSGRGLGKGRFQGRKEHSSNPFEEIPPPTRGSYIDIESLEKRALELESELRRIQEKIMKLNTL